MVGKRDRHLEANVQLIVGGQPVCKRGVKTAGQAAWAIGAVSEDFQFHGMSSSQREAGQPPAIFSMASAM